MGQLVDLETKINNCYDFGSLYTLEESFNSIGLTIQSTVSNKMVLCKVIDGKPIAENLATDFIFIGNKFSADLPIPDRLLKCIVEFARVSASAPVHIENEVCRSWKDIPHLYGEFVVIESEEMRNLAQQASIEEKVTSNNLLGAIREWLGEDK